MTSQELMEQLAESNKEFSDRIVKICSTMSDTFDDCSIEDKAEISKLLVETEKQLYKAWDNLMVKAPAACFVPSLQENKQRSTVEQ
jgi:hypothetical protein